MHTLSHFAGHQCSTAALIHVNMSILNDRLSNGPLRYRASQVRPLVSLDATRRSKVSS